MLWPKSREASHDKTVSKCPSGDLASLVPAPGEGGDVAAWRKPRIQAQRKGE